jgi:hypothetical protein
MDPKLEEALRSLDREFKRVVEYVDKEVVPAARQETHVLLRRVARALDKAAEKLEDKGPGGETR